MSKYINHSGGAIGADSAWDDIGKPYGIISKHYYIEGYKTPRGNVAIPKDAALEADKYLKETNKVLKRKYPTNNEYVNCLLRRNLWQVINSEAIFAISTITNSLVDGGTGWATHTAILGNLPTYVFDQNLNKWFKWYEDVKTFGEIEIPVLTLNFAGIGTRNINDNGLKAINDVYLKTFK